MRTRKKQKGLGLVILVLTILGLSIAAGAILMSAFVSFDEQASRLTQTKLKALALAISTKNLSPAGFVGRTYESDVGALPSALADLMTKPGAVATCAMSVVNEASSGWCGPYWTDTYQNDASFNDGWGRALVYNSAARKVTSSGPDGVAGNADDLAQNF